MLRRVEPAAGRRIGWMAFALAAAVLLSASFGRAQAAPAAQAAATPNQRLFANDGGMILNFIKPDKTADFEEVMGKLKEALAKSSNPQRKEQAAGWKIFKSPEPGAGGAVVYVMIIDPAVKGADYQVSNLLVEGLGNNKETQDLYTKYAGAYASGQNVLNLQLALDLGK
jgi:hypothetical protein